MGAANDQPTVGTRQPAASRFSEQWASMIEVKIPKIR
jgi:hypothetical protein